MALKISNIQDPGVEKYVRGEIARPYSEGFGSGGVETQPGVFGFTESPIPEWGTPPGEEFGRRSIAQPTPTHPDYTPAGYSSVPTMSRSKPMFGDFGGKKTTTSRTGGGGGGSTYQTWQPSGPAPTYEAGTFEAPEYDERAIAAGQQRFAAPGLRRLRHQIATTQAQTYENPNVKAMTIREALQGYGSGVEKTLAGAYRTAAADYERKYRTEWDERMTNFRAQEAAKQQTFQAALASWSKAGTTVRGPGRGSTARTSVQPAPISSYTTTGIPGTPSRGY